MMRCQFPLISISTASWGYTLSLVPMKQVAEETGIQFTMIFTNRKIATSCWSFVFRFSSFRSSWGDGRFYLADRRVCSTPWDSRRWYSSSSRLAINCFWSFAFFFFIFLDFVYGGEDGQLPQPRLHSSTFTIVMDVFWYQFWLTSVRLRWGTLIHVVLDIFAFQLLDKLLPQVLLVEVLNVS